MIFCFTYDFIVELNGTFNVEFRNINYNNIPLLLGEVSTYSKNMAAHYTGDQFNDVIMGAMAFQITSLTIVYSNVYSGADQRKQQSSALLAFVRWIHRWPVNFPHKWPVTREILPFEDVIMMPPFLDGRQAIYSWLACEMVQIQFDIMTRILFNCYQSCFIERSIFTNVKQDLEDKSSLGN